MRPIFIAGSIIIVVFAVILVVLFMNVRACTQMACIPTMTIEFEEPAGGFLRIEAGGIIADQCGPTQGAGRIEQRSAMLYTVWHTGFGFVYPDSFEDGVIISSRPHCDAEADMIVQVPYESIEHRIMYPNGPHCPGACDYLRVRVP